MIEQYAIVTQKKEDFAVLEIERRTACGLCGQKRGCGNATWGKLLGHKSQTLTAKNDIHAAVGDAVVVGIDEHVFLKTVFYLYGIPLLGMLLSAVLAEAFFDQEYWVLLAALAGLFLAFALVKRLLSVASASVSSYAVILRQADEDGTCKRAARVDVVDFK